MNAPADLTASKVFRDGLREKRVALRSGMHRDDIEDVEIVVGEDLDVAATRQVLKIGPAAMREPGVEATGEIDAADVLEVIALVTPPLAPEAPPAVSVTGTAPLAALLPAPASSPPFLAPPSAPLIAPWPVVDDDDAFLSHAEPASAYGVTFDYEEAAARSSAVVPRVPRRRLGWIVGTVLACCVALLVGELAAGSPDASAASAASADTRAAAAAPTTRATTTTPPGTGGEGSAGAATIDVKNLPAAMVGTVAAPGGALVIDGKRVAGSSAVVACGKHVVKTAGHLARLPNQRTMHVVDVPCGGQITVH